MEQQRLIAMPINRAAEFEDLFHQHWEGVYGVCFRLTGDHAEAEDLALETFWRLWQNPPAPSGPLGGWLYRVAVRLGYNALRAARRRQDYEQQAGQSALRQDAPAGLETEIEHRQQRTRIHSILAKMDARRVQALILRQAGLSYQEMAVALQVKPGSIGSLLARAEKEFEELYEGE